MQTADLWRILRCTTEAALDVLTVGVVFSVLQENLTASRAPSASSSLDRIT